MGGLPFVLTSLADHFDPLPAVPETGATFLDNALLKARWVYRQKGGWVLADDSGLEVDALGGLPGVRSARFAGEGAGSAANNLLLLERLRDVPPERRTARFRCVLVFVRAAESYFSAEGVCEGVITTAPRGSGGFGYDPLFVPKGCTRTFAELTAREKHAISHRGRAIERMRAHLYECCT
jgi:XTP/dITP diphosphohydrolase